MIIVFYIMTSPAKVGVKDSAPFSRLDTDKTIPDESRFNG